VVHLLVARGRELHKSAIEWKLPRICFVACCNVVGHEPRICRRGRRNTNNDRLDTDFNEAVVCDAERAVTATYSDPCTVASAAAVAVGLPNDVVCNNDFILVFDANGRANFVALRWVGKRWVGKKYVASHYNAGRGRARSIAKRDAVLDAVKKVILNSDILKADMQAIRNRLVDGSIWKPGYPLRLRNA